MTTLDGLIAAAQAERARLGHDAPVWGHLNKDGSLSLTTQPQAAPKGRRYRPLRDAALAAAASAVGDPGSLEHAVYTDVVRPLGDYRALRNGRLPNRLARRYLTRNVWGKAMRRLG